MNCWASELGDCGGGQSGEHLVSANLWRGPSVTVEGFAWCKDSPRTIGVGSLTANILCRDHNAGLSSVDAAGGNAFRTFQDFVSLGQARRKVARGSWIIRSFAVDGPMLERWFLKTLINLHLAHVAEAHWAGAGIRFHPPLDLVRAAYGLGELEPPRGLYTVASVGEQTSHRDGIEFAPLFGDNDVLVGGVFLFLGFRFILWLIPEHVPPDERLHAGKGRGLFLGQKIHRITRMNHDVGAVRSHFVDFGWPVGQVRENGCS